MRELDPEDSLVFWGKSDQDGNYHPLLRHMLDVGHVAGIMWSECLSGRARAAVASDLGVSDPESAATAKFVAFLAAMHDIGKLSPPFQALDQSMREHIEAAGYIFPCLSGNHRHGTITVRAMYTAMQSLLPGAKTYPETAKALARIAGAHHGVFPVQSDAAGLASDSLGDERWSCARAEMAGQLWETFVDTDEIDIQAVMDGPSDPALVPLLGGLISIADWIASNTDYFTFDSYTPQPEYVELSASRARKALEMAGWLPVPAYSAQTGFRQVFSFAPNSMQQVVIELVERQTGPFLMAVEAQMGKGKTEAALYAADWTLGGGDARGLYVALPTQATSNAMFARVSQDYLHTRGHLHVQENVQLVHGNALLSKVAHISGVGDSVKSAQESVSASSWFTARKRPLLAPFGVGTIDQALLSVLQTRHWFVRLFGLANKVVVFDEVHAYDTYMSTILDHLVRWLSALNCSVILLSATLPAKRLRDLVSAYSGVDLSERVAYPRVTVAGRGKAGCLPVLDDSEPRSVLLEFGSQEPSVVARLVNNRLSGGGCAAVICNTVNRAQVVYQQLLEAMPDCDLTLFHARTPFAWRKETEEAVLRKFGKPEKDGTSPHRPPKAVVVATQVIEQSLDLDFDWILTDMAPIDLVLQRLGREHRHNRPPRPASVNSPTLTILSDGVIGGPPPKFESAGIYDRYTLLRSWLALTEKTAIQLPCEIDTLVQWVYGDEKPTDISQEWIRSLHESLESSEHERTEDCKNASSLLAPEPGYPEDIIASLSKQLAEDDNPEVHPSIRAATRDGDPSIQIVCLFRDGDVLRPACGRSVTDLEMEPGTTLTRELLDSSLSVQSRGLYYALKHQAAPAGWKKSPHLRYHRAVEFADGAAAVGRYHLTLSRELGLESRKEQS